MSAITAESSAVQNRGDLFERFRSVVARYPEREAVVTPDGTVLSFAALDAQVRRLAVVLGDSGVGVGDMVGVCLDRGSDLLAALLSVWSVGAAYVPLDPAYPQSRLDFITADARITAVICADSRSGWPATIRTLAPDATVPDPDRFALEGPVPAGTPAYVIYTSGSTGEPKGVVVTRANVAQLADALDGHGVYPTAPARVAWNASVSFDASVQQWTRVCRGDTILTLTDELRMDPQAFAEYLRRERASELDVTPSHWSVLRDPVVEVARQLPEGLRLLIGGEPIPTAMWRDLAELGTTGTVRAINLYGPTECTVDSTASVVEGDEPHIGSALPGAGVFILDDEQHPTEEGELYLTGPGLALGYLNRPTLTAERFLASPFGAPGSRMYRTGDRVRRRADGSLAYLGRVDHQVKVNGYRVELGEIEAVLAEHPRVGEAVVVVREHDALTRSLAAYWVPAAGVDDDDEPVRAHVRARLPEYLWNIALHPLSAVPLSVGGKVDRAALSALTDAVEEESDENPSPTGEFEILIAESWREVLGREQILATDDFFELGGQSLVALRVIANLKKRYGIPIRTRTVYENPRLRDLASVVEAQVAAAAS